MKKKTVTKAKKVTVPKRVRSKKFSLDVRTQEDAMTLIGHMEQLKVSAGWAIIAKLLEDSMAIMERTIITKIDPETMLKLSEDQLDELRSRHMIFDEVLKKPDSLIFTFRKSTPMHMPIYDPYHTDYKQMTKEKKEHVLEDSPSTLT